MSRVSATAVVNGRLYCPPSTSLGARSVCRSSMIRGAPRITTRVIALRIERVLALEVLDRLRPPPGA